jgi:hypothetical protein
MEAFYGGQWNDITSRVRTSDSIRIKRGQQDEGASARPSSLSFRMDNRTGWALPTNPISPLYDTAGRYTPVRCYLTPNLTTGPTADVIDTFDGRTVGSGWGTATSGQVYSTFSLASGGSAAVGSGVATHSIAGASSARGELTTGTLISDVNFLITGIAAPLATGGELEVAGAMYRGQSASLYGLVRIHITTAGAVQVKAYRAADQVQMGSTYTTGITHTGTGQPLSMRVRVIDESISVKVWVSASVEPSDYQVTFTDTSTILAGWIGLRTGRGSGNTNAGVTASYGNYEATWLDVRANMEVNSWSPEATGNFDTNDWFTGVHSGHGDSWCDVTAAGVLHRLNAGSDPLRSSAFRGISEFTPKGYWPMDDAAGSTYISGASDTSGRMTVTTGRVDYRGKDLTDWLGPHVAGDGNLVQMDAYMEYPTVSSAGNWTASFGFSNLKYDADPTIASQLGVQYIGNNWLAGGSNRTDFTLQLNGNAGTAGKIQLYRLTTSGGSTSSSTLADFDNATLFDGKFHWISLFVSDSGANVQWNILIDDVSFAAGTINTVEYTTPKRAFVSASGQFNMGHLSIIDGAFYTFGLYDKVMGSPAETPGDRFLRLCEEEGVSAAVEITGTSSDTMGPQSPSTLVALLQECAKTCDGFLYEPFGWRGLILRTKEALYNQTAIATLAYDAGGIKRVLPIIDTKNNFNDVTVKNADGRSWRATSSTGATGITSIGRITNTVDVNYDTRSLLTQLELRAGWELSKGSLTGARYPRITFDFDANPALMQTIGNVDIGRRFVISGLEPDASGQVVFATEEMIESHRRLFTLMGVPDTIWESGSYDGVNTLYDTASSSTTGAPNSVQTSFRVTTTDPADFFATGAANIPVIIGGERMTITNVAAFSSTEQTITVVRSVNGVVKAHSAGTPVRVYQAARYAL